MASVFDGRQCPRMTAVDTGSDTYAVIVSSRHITDADAQRCGMTPWGRSDDACPCCGARMVIIETFAAGCVPRHRPTIKQIRIDTS